MLIACWHLYLHFWPGHDIAQLCARLARVGTYVYTGFTSGFGLVLVVAVGIYTYTGVALTTLVHLVGISYVNTRLIQPVLSRLRKVPPKLTVWGS